MEQINNFDIETIKENLLREVINHLLELEETKLIYRNKIYHFACLKVVCPSYQIQEKIEKINLFGSCTFLGYCTYSKSINGHIKALFFIITSANVSVYLNISVVKKNNLLYINVEE